MRLSWILKLSQVLVFVLASFVVIFNNSVISQCLPVYTFTGKAAYDNLGVSVSGGGDVNNDGYDDFIIGAFPLGSLLEIGEVYVYSGIDGDTLHVFVSAEGGDGFGFSVANAGDVNNDGYADILVGAPNSRLLGRRAYVFSGKTGDTLHIFVGDTTYFGFGFSVSKAGDVNDDGFDDILVGDRGYGPTGAGRVYVFSGLNGDTLYIFNGKDSSTFFGHCVADAGDVNSDGYDDFIIGANYLGEANVGEVYVFSGNTGEILHELIGEAGEAFGYSVASAGDVNNDSFCDFIVGAPSFGSGNYGRAYVFSGLTGDTLYVFEGGTASDERLGFSVSTVGDINNDGYADFMIGSIGYGIFAVGRVLVISGQTGDSMFVFDGEDTNNDFGWSVSSAGDINDDGINDFLVGAIWYGSNDNGKAYVFSGSGCAGNRGDLNNDGNDGNILDLTILVNYIFRMGTEPACKGESDINSDGSTSNILDLTFLVNYIFRNGSAPGVCY